MSSKSSDLADIAVIGLAVMGQNLILNMNDNGFKVVAYNRTQEKVDSFLQGAAKGTEIIGASSLEDMLNKLSRPRKVMLMVKAGAVVDGVIEQLLPLLEPGDIVIDGGNSDYSDTMRRLESLSSKEIHYLGVGVSGGEEGARYGPSLMPGGDARAWPHVKEIFQAIAAKTDDGEVCCDWVGEGGAGHFVKMVHNGIEYGDMQLIAETYHFMKTALELDHSRMQSIFAEWNESELNSFLIEITADILGYREDGEVLLEKILDVAGQKGTGRLTGINALDSGIPLTLITEAVFARCLSSLKADREAAEALFGSQSESLEGDVEAWIPLLKEALFAAKIISYAQGFMLMRQVSEEQEWHLNYGNIALMWRGGCIIRSSFLGEIHKAFTQNPDLSFLGMNDFFKDILTKTVPHYRKVVAKAIELGIPMPCMSSGLNFFHGYSSAWLPANMLQAQRDYFGAHTYERLDGERGKFHHTNWTGRGGETASSTYDA